MTATSFRSPPPRRSPSIGCKRATASPPNASGPISGSTGISVSPAARRAGYDTLIVHFDGGFARTVKLVRGANVRALLHQLGQSNHVAAATPHP